MNYQQRTAMADPCQYAEQCTDPRYRSVERKGKYWVSCILTLNVGEE